MVEECGQKIKKKLERTTMMKQKFGDSGSNKTLLVEVRIGKCEFNLSLLILKKSKTIFSEYEENFSSNNPFCLVCLVLCGCSLFELCWINRMY